MSYTVELIRGSAVYSVSDGNPYWAMSMTGLGLPPIRLLKERGPQQHGSTAAGYILDERLLNLILLIDRPTEALADIARQDLAEILKPIAGVPVTVRITRNDGEIRQIDSYTVGIVDFPNTRQDRSAGKQQVVVQLEAPDPIPYDPELQNIIFTIATGAGAPGGFSIPTQIPMESTVTSAIDDIESLTYNGKWETYPIIYLTGPADDAVITNNTIGKTLSFEGHSISAGVTYEIDLRYGYKVITDNLGVRQNAALTDDSDLATWRIAPSPQATGGVNDIHVYIPAGVTSDTKIRVEFYNRYPSIG